MKTVLREATGNGGEKTDNQGKLENSIKTGRPLAEVEELTNLWCKAT